MRATARVLVLNNYPLEEVWEEVRRGEKPDHHLYGVNHFGELGFEVDILPALDSQRLSKWAKLFKRALWPIPLGDLEHQWRAWRRLNEYDLLYAPCGGETNLLAYLRAMGWLRTPIVSLQHHALNRGRLAWMREPWVQLQVRGTDAFPALSRLVADEINARHPLGRLKSSVVRWGPDATFYPASESAGEGIVAAGRTGRDFLTFGRAASQTKYPTQIICMDYDLRPEFSEFAENVEVITSKVGKALTYPEMMRHFRSARVLAIPLYDNSQSLAGLTGLLDALALGKPVIMTRHPLIDLDLESIGIGRWVAPGDVEGWRDAIRWFSTHAEDSREMGRRARALVDANFNSQTFAADMAAIFNQVCEPCGEELT